MTKRERRHVSAEQKAALLKRHLMDKVPVSQVCNEAKIQPSMFYRWHRELMEGAVTVFAGASRRAPSREQELVQKVAVLEAKLQRKDVVIAEVSEEYVKLKKALGEP
jgi:transposase